MKADRDFTRQLIARRQANKARYPRYTAARKELKRATAKLVKQCGGDALSVMAYDSAGRHLLDGGMQSLQRGETVTLKQWRCVRPGAGILDPGEYEITGEITAAVNS
jgi:hypothetical protein